MFRLCNSAATSFGVSLLKFSFRFPMEHTQDLACWRKLKQLRGPGDDMTVITSFGLSNVSESPERSSCVCVCACDNLSTL